MSSREKFLAIAVGSLLALFALFTVYRSITGGLQSRRAQITSLDKQILKQEQIKTQSQNEFNLVQKFRERSLDENVDTANVGFNKWLKGQVAEAEFENDSVTYKDIRANTDNYKELTYSVTGDGNIEQVTDLLCRIQAADTLHRIEMISLRPSPNTGKLKLDMNIAALSMPNGGKEKIKIGTLSEAKLTKSADEYRDAIAARNMFAPPNSPPEFGRAKDKDVELGNDLNWRLSASDPDDHELSFDLISGPDGAELDGTRLKWEPEELGEYEFKVRVTDDGVPAKSANKTLIVNVVPKPEPPPAQKREGFDDSTVAYWTGFVKGPKDPEPAIWIDVRSKGESITLYEGDEIEIGKWKGFVKEFRINKRTIVLENEDGDHFEMRIGEKLSNAKKIEI